MGFLGPTLQPLFSEYVCHPAIVGIAQTILDSHVRIANGAQRNLNSDDQAPGDELGGYGRCDFRPKTIESPLKIHFKSRANID